MDDHIISSSFDRADEPMDLAHLKIDDLPKFSNDNETFFIKPSDSCSSTKEEISSRESEFSESSNLISDEEGPEKVFDSPYREAISDKSNSLSQSNDLLIYQIIVVIPAYNIVGKWLQHTEYQINLIDSQRRFSVHKRYSDFVKLDAQLRKTYRENSLEMELPKLPPKRYWDRMKDSFVEKRRKLLENYLQEVINTQCNTYSKAVLQFLNADDLTQLIYNILHWTTDTDPLSLIQEVYKNTATRKKSLLKRLSHPCILQNLFLMEMNNPTNQTLICKIIHPMIQIDGVADFLKSNNYLEELIHWMNHAYHGSHLECLDYVKAFCISLVKKNPTILESFLSLRNGVKMCKGLLRPIYHGEFDNFISQIVWYALDIEEIQILLGDLNHSEDNLLDLLLQSSDPVSLFLTGLSLTFLIHSSRKKFEIIRNAFHDYINTITKKMIQAQFDTDTKICDIFLNKLSLTRIRKFLSSNNQQSNIITHFILWCCSYILKAALSNISQSFINKFKSSIPDASFDPQEHSFDLNNSVVSGWDPPGSHITLLSPRLGYEQRRHTPERAPNRYYWFTSLVKHINSNDTLVNNLRKAFYKYGIHTASYHYLHSSFSNESFFAYILLWVDKNSEYKIKPDIINKMRWINEFSSTNPSFLNASSKLQKHEIDEGEGSEIAGNSSDEIFSDEANQKPLPSFKPFLGNPFDHLYKRQKVIKTLLPYINKKLSEFKLMIDAKEIMLESLNKRISVIELDSTEERLIGALSEQYPIFHSKQLSIMKQYSNHLAMVRSYKSIFEELIFFEERLKNSLDAFGQKLNESNSNMTELNEKFKVIKNLEDELKNSIETAKTQFKDLFSIRRYIKQLKDQLKSLKIQASQKRFKWSEINRKILELPEFIRSIEDELEAKKTSYNELENRNESLNSLIENALAEMTERDEKINKIISHISELDKFSSQLNHHITDQDYQFEVNNTENEHIQDQKYQLIEMASFLGIINETDLPTHEVDLTSEYFANLLSLTTFKRNRISEELNELSKLHDQNDNSIKELKSQKISKSKALKKAGNDIERLQKLYDEHSNMQDLETQSENLREKALEYDTKVNELNTEIAALEKSEKEKSPFFDIQKAEIYEKEKELSNKKANLGNLINEANEYQPTHIRNIQKIESSMRSLVAILDCLTSDTSFIQQNFNGLRQSIDSRQETKVSLRYEIINYIEHFKQFLKRLEDEPISTLNYEAN